MAEFLIFQCFLKLKEAGTIGEAYTWLGPRPYTFCYDAVEGTCI